VGGAAALDATVAEARARFAVGVRTKIAAQIAGADVDAALTAAGYSAAEMARDAKLLRGRSVPETDDPRRRIIGRIEALAHRSTRDLSQTQGA